MGPVDLNIVEADGTQFSFSLSHTHTRAHTHSLTLTLSPIKTKFFNVICWGDEKNQDAGEEEELGERRTNL